MKSPCPLSGVRARIIVMCLVYMCISLASSRGVDADRLRAKVQAQETNPVVEEVVVVGAALASLGAIVFVFIQQVNGTNAVVDALLGLTAVGMNWLMLHMMYATRYAHLYYTGEEGGLDFNQGDVAPVPVDFWYFSFTIGMSFAVSDVIVKSSRLRGVIVRHAVMSYAFSAVILGCTINLIASILAN